MDNCQITKNREGKVDRLNPMSPLYVGTFERFVEVGEKTRRVLVYIPEGARPSCAGVFVLGDNGQTAENLLLNSRWRELADHDPSREKFVVFFLEPEGGVWNTGEVYKTKGGDIEYVNAVYALGCERTLTCVHESKMYLFGCGEGGIIANMAAMDQPALWAGVCSISASDVPDDYMLAVSEDLCLNLNGFEDENYQIRMKKGEIGVPACLIYDPLQPDQRKTEAYWKKACGITEKERTDEQGNRSYVRSEQPPFPVNQEKEAYRVVVSEKKGAATDYGNCVLEQAKEFLFSQRRWMGDPGGDLRITKDPVRDIGMEYHEGVIDGWLREWYVYLPEEVKAHPERKFPLVLAMHGYSCSGEIYAGDSEWYKVADSYGFILVHPSATPGKLMMETKATSAANMKLPAWNIMHSEVDGPDENRFFRYLLEKLKEDYPVDHQRVFATGHSYGSLMTQILGMTMSDQFAAVAPCSGVFFPFDALDIQKLPEVKHRPDGQEVPVWMFVGEEEEWLLPHCPTADNAAGQSIFVWRKINHLGSEMPEDFNSGWDRHGIWNDLTYRNKDGIPMVRYTWVKDLPHAVTTEICLRIWKEFFSKLSKENGIVRYKD